MAIQVVGKNQQARGQFNGGEILENKPIGFPREGGQLRPYSNLFYWAHAWSDHGSTIPLHPHQGFEIMSFVLQGSIEHFDTKLNKWITLEKGAAQIIRAGNGISHSEKINANAHMFQIWFDPDLGKTMGQEPTYNDYNIAVFPEEQKGGLTILTYKGEGSPLLMDAPEVEIHKMIAEEGEHQINLSKDHFHSFYLIDGKLNVNEQSLGKDDFFIVSDQSELNFVADEKSVIFRVKTPKVLGYKTYAQRIQETVR